jgi:hypothetical protein
MLELGQKERTIIMALSRWSGGFHHNHFSSINQSSRVSGLGFFYKKRKAFKKTREKVVKQTCSS